MLQDWVWVTPVGGTAERILLLALAQLDCEDYHVEIPLSQLNGLTGLSTPRIRTAANALWKLGILEVTKHVGAPNEWHIHTPRPDAHRPDIFKTPKASSGELARDLASEWWEGRQPRPMQPYIAVAKLAQRALERGWNESQVRVALSNQTNSVSIFSLERELRTATPPTQSPIPRPAQTACPNCGGWGRIQTSLGIVCASCEKPFYT